MSIFDDIWSWLTTSPGGSAGGAPLLGPGSPTAATQTPALSASAVASPMAPTLGGQPLPPRGGLLSGLLGGQQPVNPMSYFMPRQGLLGNSPLGMGLRGGLAGLAAGAGVGGLSGLGAGAMGGQQEEMQRRQNQMNTVLAGQQYQQGQQALVSGTLQMQFALDRANIIRRRLNQPELTMADLINNPMLATSPAAAQTATAVPATGGGTVGAMGVPIVPTTPGVNSNVAAAYGVSPTTGMSAGDVLKQYPEAINAPRDVQDQAAIAFYRKYGGAPWRASQPQGTPVDPVPPASMSDDEIRSRLAPIMARESAGQNVPNAQGGPASGYYQFLPNSWQEAIRLAYPGAGGQGQQPTMTSAAAGQTQQPTTAAPPDAVEQSYQQQIDDALASGDLVKADEAQTKLAEYQQAAGHAASTVTATGAAQFETPQARYEREQKQQEIQRTQLNNLRGDYEKQDAVKIYRQAMPAATAFGAIYRAHGANTNTPGPNYQGDYALIINALKTINPDAASPRPGQAISATDLATLPAQLQKAILSAWNNQTALPGDAVDQLAKAVQNQISVYQKDQQRIEAHFRDRAKTEVPGVPETSWNTDLPIPPPDAIKALQANPTKAMIADFDDTFGIGAAAQLGITAKGG